MLCPENPVFHFPTADLSRAHFPTASNRILRGKSRFSQALFSALVNDSGYLAAAGPALGFASLCIYHWYYFSDPLLYIHSKSAWGQTTGSPLRGLIDIFSEIFAPVVSGHPAPLLKSLQLMAVIAAGAATFIFYRRKQYAEAIFVGSNLCMSLISGSIDGFSRYCVFLFPMFTLLPIKKRPLVFPMYLIVATAVQGYLLIRYVFHLTPPP